MKAKQKQELPILLAIDPSVRDLGWAMINLNKIGEEGYGNILDYSVWSYGIIEMKSTNQVDPKIVKYRWKEAYEKMVAAMDWRPTHFASEWPTFFDSERGRIAAVNNYTVGIASMVGYLAAAFDFHPDDIRLYTPIEWKGMIGKEIVREKFIKLFGPEGSPQEPAIRRLDKQLSDDTIEAIMIARYWLDQYDQGKISTYTTATV